MVTPKAMFKVLAYSVVNWDLFIKQCRRMKKITRNYSLDLVRIMALFSVISVHFFLNSGYYNQSMLGKRMYLMTVMRTFFMVCVPLFLVLTGYLMSNKSLCRQYYRGLLKTIGIYIAASIVCIIYKSLFLDAKVSVSVIVKGILDFSAADYSWYVEMYIGLFLLIPFLNIIYKNLESKKQKWLLIITMLVLTSFPNVLNIYNFDVEGWWKAPILSSEYRKIFPSWWNAIFPLTYYYIGCYLKEYGMKIKKSANIALLLIAVMVFGTFNYYRSYGGEFVWGEYQSWGALPNVIMTLLVFGVISSFKLEKLSSKGKYLLAGLSDLCFGAYLLSYIFDSAFYPFLNSKIHYMPERLDYFIIIVPLVLVCSFVLSSIINMICSVIVKSGQIIVHKFKNL